MRAQMWLCDDCGNLSASVRYSDDDGICRGCRSGEHLRRVEVMPVPDAWADLSSAERRAAMDAVIAYGHDPDALVALAEAAPCPHQWMLLTNGSLCCTLCAAEVRSA